MKKVLLTGASKGIGLAIGKGLLNSGFMVTGTYNRTDIPAELYEYDTFSSITVDLSDVQDAAGILKKEIIENPPDILINNAGIFEGSGIIDQDSSWLDTWERTMAINLKAPSILCKWFINGCLKNKTKGIIINIASRAAYRGDQQEYAAYAASKGGLAAYTKSIARGFSQKGIVAYTIAPGFIKTEMADSAIEQFGLDGLTRDSAFNDITTPEEVASLVVWLARGEVLHMSGSTFHINGGSYMT